MSVPTADDLLDAVALALRDRVADLARADAARVAFVFGDGRGPARAAGDLEGAAWASHLSRALHLATSPATLDLLRDLGAGDRTIADMTDTTSPGGDRLATGAWVGDLAAAGLVGRDLETDRVARAPLGTAVVELLDALAQRAAVAPAENP